MANVEKISIALPPELIGLVRQAIDSGMYSSTSEVIREALRDWKEKQEHKAVATKQLKRLWREGIASGPGRFSSMGEIKAEARNHLRHRIPVTVDR